MSSSSEEEEDERERERERILVSLQQFRELFPDKGEGSETLVDGPRERRRERIDKKEEERLERRDTRWR